MSALDGKVPRIIGGLVIASATLIGGMHAMEGREEIVYADSLASGLPTVCSGHVDPSLRIGSKVTAEACDRMDAADAEKFGSRIIECTGHGRGVTLNQNQFDALTLFAINVGAGAACGSRAVKLIKQGRPEDGCKALANAPNGKPAWSYTNHGATFVPGLYKRRKFERDLCLRPIAAPAPAPAASTSVAAAPAPAKTHWFSNLFSAFWRLLA